MRLTIDPALLAQIPAFNVIAYTMDVSNMQTLAVEQLLRKTENECASYCDLVDVVNVPKIKEGRDAYKKLGKDPSRYRLAVEALLRRTIRQMPLYRIGDLVDLGNILSLQTLRSVCVVDADKINGDVIIREGTTLDEYDAIHRGTLNISQIPVYADDIGPFGTPTSDTPRTSISSTTTRILVMIICFSEQDLSADENRLIQLFTQYANATNLIKIEV